MADATLAGLGTSAAPLAYTVPGGQEIVIKSLRASFDGTAAASAWYPAIRITAPGGPVDGVYIPASSVAAGASADVSFFPGAEEPAATATTAKNYPNVATVWRSVSNNGDATQTVGANNSVAITFVHTSLPSDGSVSWSALVPYFLTFNVECMAVSMLWVQMDGGAYSRAVYSDTNSRILQASIPTPAGVTSLNTAPVSGNRVWLTETKPNAFVVNDTVSTSAYNGDAVSHTISEAWWVVYFWPVTGYGGGIPGWPP